MRFDEQVEGDYCIYAGALEALRGDGYTAAVVMHRLQGMPHGTSPEVWRDTAWQAAIVGSRPTRHCDTR
jgi:hypothetical protein